MGGTGNWPEDVASRKVPGDAVTEGSNGEGEALGSPTNNPIPLTDAVKSSSACLWDFNGKC